MKPTCIDLFCGAGGLSLGFEQAGFDVLLAVDIDPIHCATHEFNFPTTKIICGDITHLSWKKLRNSIPGKSHNIDVVFGGAPCQGFSMIGKRALDDPRNLLVKHFARLVLEIKPKYFLFENVEGLALNKHKAFLKEFCEEFQRNGYEIKLPYQILNAKDFGVPQSRRRLFILGNKSGLNRVEYPNPTVFSIDKIPQQDLLIKPEGPSAWDAIGDLPVIENYPELLERDWAYAEYGKPSFYATLMRGEARENDYGYQRVWDKNLLTSSLRTKHTEKSKARFKSTPLGKIEPISKFFKLDPNGLCNTLRAGTASDKGAFTSARPIHPYIPRCITVREAARLQSFPDWFRFHVTKWHGFRQVGNSVPPLLAKSIAVKILEALGKKPKQSSKKIKLDKSFLLEFSVSTAAKYYGVPSDVTGRRLRKMIDG